MVDLTNNTTTTVDARGSQGYQEHSWAGSGAEVGIPNTTFLYAFKVSGTPSRAIEHATDREA